MTITTALAFSGGKDSLAALFVNSRRLDEIVVLWVNTGKNYPEVLETINSVRAMCPNFVEILSDRVGQNAYWGIPADVVPTDWTREGQEATGEKPVMIQNYLKCCIENIGLVLLKYCSQRGITELISGQRNADKRKSTSRDGDVVQGVTYRQPIADWSDAQVMDFVGQHLHPIPEHMKLKHSSMDCYDCTAYRADSADRVALMRDRHPEMFAEYAARRDALNAALAIANEGCEYATG